MVPPCFTVTLSSHWILSTPPVVPSEWRVCVESLRQQEQENLRWVYRAWTSSTLEVKFMLHVGGLCEIVSFRQVYVTPLVLCSGWCQWSVAEGVAEHLHTFTWILSTSQKHKSWNTCLIKLHIDHVVPAERILFFSIIVGLHNNINLIFLCCVISHQEKWWWN